MQMNSEIDLISLGRKSIEHTYGNIWHDWFASTPGAMQASLRIDLVRADSGYRPERNELYLNLSESDIEEAARNIDHWTAPPPGMGWPLWKRELIHELLHEYQHKVLAGTASAAGIAFKKKHGSCFLGPGHGVDFFEAIAEKADYFGISAECLISNL